MKSTIAEQMMRSTFRIEMMDENETVEGTGTGFIFTFCQTEETFVPALVTNRHVLGNCKKIRLTFTRGHDGVPVVPPVLDNVVLDTSRTIFHPDPSIDLAVLPIAHVLDTLHREGKDPVYRYIDQSLIPSKEAWAELDAIEEVTMVGYPRGLLDPVNNLPIFRRGITATHPAYDFKGEPKFLVDMACYPGSSGSPVFIYHSGGHTDPRRNAFNLRPKVLFLGVQHAAPISKDVGDLIICDDTKTTLKPVIQSYFNLGIIIKSTELLAFEPILRSMTNK